jgi:tetratricopeptide (TPR) repeat protein
MAKRISIVVIFTLICVSLGCQSPNAGSSYQLPARTTPTQYSVRPVNPDFKEIDVIEKIVGARQQYKENLENIINYYSKTGNNEKLGWAQTELDALNKMVQYDYYDYLDLEGPEPVLQIMDADLLFNDAILQMQQAERLGQAFVNKDLYRSALGKFRDLIKKYQKSDKVDDAAYYAGVISEYFKDYSPALDFYKASYKWNPENTTPVRFRAARMLDRYMHNYAEALPIYREAIEKEGRFSQNFEWKKNAEERVKELEKTVQQ